jgi:hypothetical protein
MTYFVDTETDRLIKLIEGQARAWTSKELQLLKDAAESQRPIGIDTTSKAIALRYSGDQTIVMKAALRKRYELAWETMPVSPLRYIKQWASQDAGAYTRPPDRYLTDAEGERVDEEGEDAKWFAWLCGAASLVTVMPEVERRCLSGAGACAVFVGWRHLRDEPALQIYWPHDVYTVCHPDGVDDPAYLIAVALRQRGPKEEGDAWWVWSREVTETESGPVFGQWHHAKVTEKGAAVLPVPYAAEMLPIAFARTIHPEGTFFGEPDGDVVAMSDSLNVSRSNELHIIDKQAHAVPVVSSDTYDGKDLALSPDVILPLRGGDTMQYVAAGADFAALLASREQNIREIASTRGNNPGAYSASVGVAESGVARMIANIPHERRMAEIRPVFQTFEEQQLLPILVDVFNAFHSQGLIADGLVPRVTLAEPITYEDKEAKQRRLVVDLDLGVISKAAYAVEMGHYRTIDDAVAAGLSSDLAGAPQPLDAVMESVSSTDAEVDINQLTLGIERLGRLGDTDGLNALREALAKRLGIPLAPVSSPELAVDAATIAGAVE